MTLKAMVRIAGLFALAIIAIFIIVGNQRPAHAEVVPPDLGSQIVCLVYSDLNSFGSPIPVLSASGCAATSTPSGGGTLTVVKIVSGTSTPSSDFKIHVKSGGSDISSSPQLGSSTGVAFIGLTPGVYAVSEESNAAGVNLSDFTASYGSGCPAGVALVVAGQTTTCTITNTWSASNGGGGGVVDTTSDLSMTKTADKTSVNPGDTVTYTLTVHNGGPASATGVSVSDLLPSGVTFVSTSSADTVGLYSAASGTWTIGSLANGSSATLHISATINSGTNGQTITNTARVSDGNGDKNSGNNSGSSSITVNSSGGGCTGSCGGGGGPTATSSDLAITKTVDNAAPDKDDTLTYTLTVSDTGLDATGVVVHDSLPAGLTFVSTTSADTVGVYDSGSGNWTIGTLASTTSATLHITAQIGSHVDYGTVITNSAAVTAGDSSGDSSNNTASASVTVTNPHSGGGGCGDSCGGGGCGTSCGGGGGNGPIVGLIGLGGGGNGPIVAPTGIVLGESTSTGDCSQFLTAFIKTGKKNDPEQVMRLQTVLHDDEGANIEVNGTYDAATVAAVLTFQSKYAADVLKPWGISKPTGYVYLTTRKKINEIYCHNTKVFSLTPSQQKIIAAAKAETTKTVSMEQHTAAPVNPAHHVPVPVKTKTITRPVTTVPVTATTTPQIGASAGASTTPVRGNPVTDFLSRIFGRH